MMAAEHDDLLANEADLLQALLAAAEDVQQTVQTVAISRNGRELFRFRVRALTEPEVQECRTKASHFRANRLGVMVPAETDMARFKSLLIYRATVEEDRRRLWDNKQAQERLGVLNGWDLIDRVLLAGEKDPIAHRVLELSGFRDTDEADVELKNS